MAGPPQLKTSKRHRKPTTSMGECDRLFSKIVRLRDGRCQACGATEMLQCAHIFTRSRKATRCSELNAKTLCLTCHLHFGTHHDEWVAWCIEQMGEAAYEALRIASENGRKPNWTEVAARLRPRLRALEAQ